MGASAIRLVVAEVPPYIDVSGDNRLSGLDVLQVITHILSTQQASVAAPLVAAPTPSRVSPITIDELPSSTARAGPTRCTSGPASGIDAMAAADMHSNRRPKPPADRLRSSRTAGARANQPTYARPLVVKVAPTATLATSRRGRSTTVVTRPT